MNLNWIGCEDLRAFRDCIDIVVSACGPLEKAGFCPEISLSDAETLIRCEPILPEMAPGLTLVEPDVPPASFEVEPAVDTAAPVAVPEVAAVEVSPPAKAEPAPVAKPALAATAPAEKPAALIEGPLSDAEKALIMKMTAAGRSSREVGAALNRKSQTVGLFLSSQALAADKAEEKAQAEAQSRLNAVRNGFRSVRECADPIVKDVTRAVTSPPSAPVPDTLPGPVPAPVSVATPQDVAVRDVIAQKKPLSGLDRVIVAHLDSLPVEQDWDLTWDMGVCQAFAAGTKLAQVALDHGMDAQWIKQRYALVTQPIRNDRGHLTIEGQERMLHLLRHMCSEKRGAA